VNQWFGIAVVSLAFCCPAAQTSWCIVTGLAVLWMFGNPLWWLWTLPLQCFRVKMYAKRSEILDFSLLLHTWPAVWCIWCLGTIDVLRTVDVCMALCSCVTKYLASPTSRNGTVILYFACWLLRRTPTVDVCTALCSCVTKYLASPTSRNGTVVLYFACWLLRRTPMLHYCSHYSAILCSVLWLLGLVADAQNVVDAPADKVPCCAMKSSQ